MWLRESTKENAPLILHITKLNIDHILNDPHTLSKTRQAMKVVEGFGREETLRKYGPYNGS